MSKLETHTQCHLKRGNVSQVSWIPSEYAIKGNYVKLKEKGVWEDGWLITTDGGITFPSKYIKERERDYKETRKASDI